MSAFRIDHTSVEDSPKSDFQHLKKNCALKTQEKSSTSTEPNTLTKLSVLPDELLEMVFSHFQANVLQQISGVNREWQRLSSQDRMWERFVGRSVASIPRHKSHFKKEYITRWNIKRGKFQTSFFPTEGKAISRYIFTKDETVIIENTVEDSALFTKRKIFEVWINKKKHYRHSSDHSSAIFAAGPKETFVSLSACRKLSSTSNLWTLRCRVWKQDKLCRSFSWEVSQQYEPFFSHAKFEKNLLIAKIHNCAIYIMDVWEVKIYAIPLFQYFRSHQLLECRSDNDSLTVLDWGRVHSYSLKTFSMIQAIDFDERWEDFFLFGDKIIAIKDSNSVVAYSFEMEKLEVKWSQEIRESTHHAVVKPEEGCAYFGLYSHPRRSWNIKEPQLDIYDIDSGDFIATVNNLPKYECLKNDQIKITSSAIHFIKEGALVTWAFIP